jgi:hypothetical protein
VTGAGSPVRRWIPIFCKANPAAMLISRGGTHKSSSHVRFRRQGVKDTGYVEGENMAIEYRSRGPSNRLAPRADEVIE